MPSATVAPSSPPSDIDAYKRRLRAEMIERRKQFGDPGVGPRLAENILQLGPFRPGAPVSGFYPMAPEIDVLPALSWFAGHGHPTALPVVVGRRVPLVFRAWTPGGPLERGVLGIPFPGAGTPEIVPEILLVPLLAFDRRGHRLGYGCGYYDRTLADLRAKGPVLAIGVGFSFQEIGEVPATPTDQRIDAIVTERAAERLA